METLVSMVGFNTKSKEHDLDYWRWQHIQINDVNGWRWGEVTKAGIGDFGNVGCRQWISQQEGVGRPTSKTSAMVMTFAWLVNEEVLKQKMKWQLVKARWICMAMLELDWSHSIGWRMGVYYCGGPM
jgi:hypothetical protein